MNDPAGVSVSAACNGMTPDDATAVFADNAAAAARRIAPLDAAVLIGLLMLRRDYESVSMSCSAYF